MPHAFLFFTLMIMMVSVDNCSAMKETRPESANSRSAWGLDGDDADVTDFSRQKSTGIDIQSGGPSMVSSHQALGINDSFMSKIGRGVRCMYIRLLLSL